MPSAKNTVELNIGGSKYRMVTDTDADHLKRLAAQVNARIDGLGPKTTRTLSPAQVLAIVSLTLAEELDEATRRLAHVDETSQTVARSAVARIDAVLAEAGAAR